MRESGRINNPTVFAARYRRISYDIVDDTLKSYYLHRAKRVPSGIYYGENSDPLKSIADVSEALSSGKIAAHFVGSGSYDQFPLTYLHEREVLFDEDRYLVVPNTEDDDNDDDR